MNADCRGDGCVGSRFGGYEAYGMCICATVMLAILVMDSVGAMDAVCGNCSACDGCDACVGCDARLCLLRCNPSSSSDTSK